MAKILNLLIGTGVGGIERLCESIAKEDKTQGFLSVKDIGPILKSIDELGVKTYKIYDDSKMTISKNLRVLNKVEKIIKEDNYDTVIVEHTTPILWIIAYLLKKRNKHLKVYAYAHCDAYDFYATKSFMTKLVFKRMMKKIDGIFSISNSVTKSIIKYIPSIDKNKIYLNYNGVDLSRFKRKNKTNGVPILIYVGRLIKDKGVENTLEMLSKIDCDYIFNVCGDGPYRKGLEELTDKLNLTNKVNFLGNINDVSSQLGKSDIFIHLPNWEEGFGITVAEAMASGLICIVNNKGAMEELIDNNTNGYVLPNCEEGSIKKLRSIIENVNSKENNQIRLAAIQKSKMFDINNTIRTIYDVVDNK